MKIKHSRALLRGVKITEYVFVNRERVVIAKAKDGRKKPVAVEENRATIIPRSFIRDDRDVD